MPPTEFVVDLRAIARNLETVRARGGGRAVIAAIKADAYGHGMVPVAKHLEPHVLGFGVATVPEALTLREAGIGCMLLKLSPALAEELPGAIAGDVSLVIGSLRSIDVIADAARELGKIAEVHLSVDTGMHRVGIMPDDARAAAVAIADNPHLHLDGVMTHYAVSDVEDGREFTRQQHARFAQAVAEVKQVCDVQWVHSGNSGAILNHDLGDDNAIRPGIALYGSAPELNRHEQGLLEPAARWTSRVALVKPVKEGDGVSYGLTWHAPRDTTIATVAVGYGDGFSRLNSSRGRVLIDGRSYPVVGRVCMDQILVDLGPESGITEGAEVVLLGASGDERITTHELADLMGTIPYEVTCLVTQRVTRRYVSGG
ncbi:alanine racemase [uncultured Tessaracoccus sp.]|uniref:alanine racemase n=1 Tax=uncultured Tessaracoccus sp. TaxID=905023 RepID=UPI00262087BC|nr:alanine racemase [uncultured Tessaracoccus sp.]